MVLARQAQQYALFFDLDVYGGREGEEGADRVEQIVWGNEQKILLRSISAAILRVYPSLSSRLQVLVYGASGICKKKARYKASYHLVFPQIIVDRPVYAWPDGPDGHTEEIRARHIIVRDHILYCFDDEMQESAALAQLYDDLLDCCNHETVDATLQDDEDTDDSPTFLNEWSEVFDEKPFWFEPEPEALSGLRLPYTDKNVPELTSCERRPKLPLGRYQLAHDAESGEISIEQLADLPALDWIRLGDISVCIEGELTPWEADAIHKGVGYDKDANQVLSSRDDISRLAEAT